MAVFAKIARTGVFLSNRCHAVDFVTRRATTACSQRNGGAAPAQVRPAPHTGASRVSFIVRSTKCDLLCRMPGIL